MLHVGEVHVGEVHVGVVHVDCGVLYLGMRLGMRYTH